MKKKKPWKREVRYLYLFMLRDKIIDINKAIGYYETCGNLAYQAMNDPDCPESVRKCITMPYIPKYIIWAQKYLAEDEE